ncbi:MAG: hypothetical protein AB8B58_11470 [Roseobacter sp.]
MFDVEARYSLPPWIDTINEIPDRQRADVGPFIPYGVSALEYFYIPEGESLDSWSKRYSISAEKNRPEPLDIDQLFIAQYYEERCVDPGFISDPSTETEETRVFVVICSKFKSKEGSGEVGFFYLSKVRSTLIKHIYRIRVPATKVGGPPNLPRKEFDEAINKVLKLAVRSTSK